MKNNININNTLVGHLGGSVGWVSDFGSRHDLTVCEFEPHVGLCADSSEPGACFGLWVSLSHSPYPACALSLSLSLSQKEINIKKKLNSTLIFEFAFR